MDPEERTETEKTAEEDEISFYEAYWAQNTTAHGVSRVANTHKFHRIIWIVALLACFCYVTYEIYNSIYTYNLHLTTTEVNSINSQRIEFPSVTVCNFNRWRKSHLTPEVLEQLQEVIKLYSYDYVIPDIEESANPQAQPSVLDLIDPTTTLPPATPPPSTTEPPPVECKLPTAPLGMAYDVSSSASSGNTVLAGTTLTYRCTVSNTVLMDGDTVHTCSNSGEFEGRVPICISTTTTGDRYVLVNNGSHSDTIAATSALRSVGGEEKLPSITLCFWIKAEIGDQLATILSYGVQDLGIMSVITSPQTTGDVYGVKFSLFGAEGKRLTLASFNQWNPFCFQYSTESDGHAAESGSVLKLYKFLVFGSTFKLYDEDGLDLAKEFPLGGRLVMFNDYNNYLNVLANRPIDRPSAGGSISNVNIWDRTLSIDVMNTLLWEGNVYSLTAEEVFSISGTILTATLSFNVSENLEYSPFAEYEDDIHDTLIRSKRQIENSDTTTTVVPTAAITPTTTGVLRSFPKDSIAMNPDGIAYNDTTIAPNSSTTTNQAEDTLKSIFNYAHFTKTAGWQLVDAKSNHTEGEPRTLLSCTYRGKQCDSRWFTHRFGAYGNCYTFNKDISDWLAEKEDIKTPLIQDSSGPTGGLNLLLDMQTWEYSESMALNGNSELGLKFIVHAPYEVPVISSMGYAIAPGTKGFVGFTKTTRNNLYHPWGKCDPAKKLLYNKNYTLNACAIECKLKKVVEHCSCKPYYYPGDFDICTYEQLADCAFVQIAIVNADFGNICDCPIACHSETFDVKLSYTDFPNAPYGVQLGKQLNISLPATAPGVPTYDSQSQYLRGNVANLDLYYESMSEVEINQNKAMDDTALLGAIGGQLGLFIGCSVLTAIEFLECILMSTLYHCKRSGKGKNTKKRWSPCGSGDIEVATSSTNSSKKILDNELTGHKNGTYSMADEICTFPMVDENGSRM